LDWSGLRLAYDLWGQWGAQSLREKEKKVKRRKIKGERERE